MLVSVGSATFTVLSIYAFAGPGGDQGRVAAQVVSGIGFLGPARSSSTASTSAA